MHLHKGWTLFTYLHLDTLYLGVSFSPKEGTPTNGHYQRNYGRKHPDGMSYMNHHKNSLVLILTNQHAKPVAHTLSGPSSEYDDSTSKMELNQNWTGSQGQPVPDLPQRMPKA